MFKNLKLLMAGCEFHICFWVVNSRITWPNANSMAQFRKVRIMLAEKNDFAMEVEPVWEHRTVPGAKPGDEVPVLWTR